MTDEGAVAVENVSKKFCLSLKRSLWYGLGDIGREIAGRPAGTRLRRGEFWALQGVSFDLRRGEILGLVGPNGAGKTTLLRMISGLFKPTDGRIAIRGRVGPLLALGAGFNPLLSGRENVYVNGAILGISRRRVDRIFDEIVDFSGIAEFIDSPVRTYSSGMFLRLAFSVAVHMEPEIFLIDEILAVGDALFTERASQRLLEYIRRGGSAILVSHTMPVIRGTCHRAVWLDRGRVMGIGGTKEVTERYIAHERASLRDRAAAGGVHADPGAAPIRIERVLLHDAAGAPRRAFEYGEEMHVEIGVRVDRRVEDPHFSVIVKRGHETAIIFSSLRFPERPVFEPGRGVVRLILPRLYFSPGTYDVVCGIRRSSEGLLRGAKWYEEPRPRAEFEIPLASFEKVTGYVSERAGSEALEAVCLPARWEFEPSCGA